MTYSITANTPEQMRDEIVKWLKMNASIHRIAAGNTRLVAKRHEETTMGIAYQNAADFLERCEIIKA
jgi:hypothetical protein